MTCAEGCIDVDVALAFVDGRLGARRAEVEQRIDTCTRCRAIVAEAARTDDDVRAQAPTIATVSERRAKRRAAPGGLEAGTRLGRYVIERPIGAGGMGVVWLARDPELRRAVVIKLVRVDAFPDEGREALELRMRREAQAMAQLSHANVVQIFDLGEYGDRVFLAMEYVPGQTLDAWLVERERTRDEILAMFRQAGAGLAAAHRAGLVHRDFKPANVLVSSDGLAKVTDFGLARGLHAAPIAPLARSSGVHAVVTRADAIVGTPAYMAPEQADGRPVDARSDQYAFALALLDALANQPPTARDEVDVALTKANVTPRQRVAIARALATDPGERFADITPLLAAIAPPVKRRVWPIALGVALCAAAVVLWFASRPEPIVACVAEAPRAWPAATRARLVDAFAVAQPPFGAWTGAQVAGAIDRAVDRLAIDEVAACNGSSAIAPDCLARRTQALAAATRMTPDEAWPLIAAIDRCDAPSPSPVVERLRRDLATAKPGTATDELAQQAVDAGDARLAARAFERGARHALDARDFVTANRRLLAQLDAGERANDDAIRARASLALLEVARWNGDFAAADLAANRLRSLQSRQRPDPRADHAIAVAEGEVFAELGDAPRAMAAWERAIAVAPSAGDRSRARVERALQLHRQFDHAAARTELLAVIAEAPDDASRAHASLALGDLALDAGDGAAARDAYAKVPITDLAVRLRTLRARSLAGDVDGALAELDTFAGDATERVHVALAKARVLRVAGRIAEAHDIIKPLARDIHGKYLFQNPQHAFELSQHERLEVVLELCMVDIELRNLASCDSDLAKSLHSTAPIRLRLLEQRLRDIRNHDREYLLIGELERYATLLDAIHAPPELAASHRLELARHPATLEKRRREHAMAARRGFAAAGKTAEVAAIDELLRTP